MGLVLFLRTAEKMNMRRTHDIKTPTLKPTEDNEKSHSE